jgi:hypothetical protein
MHTPIFQGYYPRCCLVGLVKHGEEIVLAPSQGRKLKEVSQNSFVWANFRPLPMNSRFDDLVAREIFKVEFPICHDDT